MKDLFERCQKVLDTQFESFDFNPAIDNISMKSNTWLFLEHGSDKWVETDEINETIAVVDVETSCFWDDGVNWVLMGSVLTQKGLYLWVHPAIVSGKSEDWVEGQLLSVGSKLEVAIAHNSAFDRSRVMESYTGQLFWLDTMSFHNAQNLYCKEQRAVLAKLKDKVFKPKWAGEGSGSSLLDTYNFHVCHPLSEHLPLDLSDKKIRDLFVKAKNFKELQLEYQKLAKYALFDVIYTGRLFDFVWQEWQKSTPDRASKIGQLAHMNTTVRLNSTGLKHYLKQCDRIYTAEMTRLNNHLKTLADNLYEQWLTCVSTDLNWAKKHGVPPQFLTKSGNIKKTVKDLHWLDLFGSPNLNQFLSTLSPNLQALNWSLTCVKNVLKPKWYTQAINSQSVNGHLLLELKWAGNYLVYSQERGFYLENGQDLPRPKKGDNNVLRIFSKNFADFFQNGSIVSCNPVAEEVMKAVVRMSFWVGNRTRFTQCVNLFKEGGDRVILMPEVVAIGTTTRRSSSKIWHVLPKPSTKKLGSGFMNYVVPEAGHVLLHADLDSVEAVIAALYNGLDNEFTNSVLYGVKENETDVHSVNAKSFGIPRSAAKEFLYSSLYGSGIRGLATTLNSNNPTIPLDVATDMATRFLTGLRGVKQDGRYVGGTASRCFNKLIELTKTKSAGFLQNQYCYTLIQSAVGDDFFTSRANAGIQAVGRMMLDYWLYHCLESSPWMEFYYSVHDQLIFSCPEELIDRGIKNIQEAHKKTYFALLNYLGYEPEDFKNLHYLTSVIQDNNLGKTPSSKGVEHFR